MVALVHERLEIEWARGIKSVYASSGKPKWCRVCSYGAQVSGAKRKAGEWSVLDM